MVPAKWYLQNDTLPISLPAEMAAGAERTVEMKATQKGYKTMHPYKFLSTEEYTWAE